VEKRVTQCSEKTPIDTDIGTGDYCRRSSARFKTKGEVTRRWLYFICFDMSAFW